MTNLRILTCAAALAVASAASAQSPAVAPKVAPAARTNCAPTQAKPSEGTIAPKDQSIGQGSSSETLGDKLAQSDGVLCPPSDVDPDMRTPAPDVGTMPVVPPPGSPGGNPNIRPK